MEKSDVIIELWPLDDLLFSDHFKGGGEGYIHELGQLGCDYYIICKEVGGFWYDGHVDEAFPELTKIGGGTASSDQEGVLQVYNCSTSLVGIAQELESKGFTVEAKRA